MTIIIETRTRTTVNDPWSGWSNLTVDAVTDGTFTNTDLVEYRTSTDVSVNDITYNISGDATTNWAISGDGVFDDIMETLNRHIDAQYKLDRLKGADYASVYLGSIQAALQQATTFVLQEKIIERELALKDTQLLAIEKDIELKTAQKESIDAEITRSDLLASKDAELKTVQKESIAADVVRNDLLASKDIVLKDAQKESVTADTIRKDLLASKQAIDLGKDAELKTAQKESVTADTIRKDLLASKDATLKDIQATIGITEERIKQEQWDNYQSQIMGNQKAMSDIDTTNKATMVAKDIALKDASIAKAQNDADFILSKEQVMVDTRKDNIRIQTAKEFADFMKYTFAGDLIPVATDIENLRLLVANISAGISNPDVGLPGAFTLTGDIRDTI